jgi:hypothetical protein
MRRRSLLILRPFRRLSAHSKIERLCNLPLKVLRPLGVFFPLFGVLTAVDFDYQEPVDATKIGKVRTNPVLAEFEAPKALCSETAPQFLLLFCGIGTEASSSLSRTFIVRIHDRTPQKARGGRTPSRRLKEGAVSP